MTKQTLVMVILDGWGIGRKDSSNPIYVAQPENINYIKHHYPAGTLQASGIAVGLPWGEEGNSEVGHLTLGAGKVLYQHYPRISLAIRDGSFFANKVLFQAINHVKESGGSIHLVGLLTEGNVHASMEHLQALVKLMDNEGLTNERVWLHIFTDGVDSSPKSAESLVKKLGKVRIATVSGRFYAMDKERLDRVQTVYDVILGKAKQPPYVSLTEALEDFYKRGYSDEYVEPLILDSKGTVKNGDSIVFFNFREDRIRQLTNLFVETPLENTYICTFTKYNDKFNLPVAFPPEEVSNPLGKVFADNGLTQLRIAETEKYAHVTFFFNGFHESPFKNEFRVLIPSRNVSSHDQSPEMRAEEITERTLSAVGEGGYDFILVNYANSDMVAHTGNYDAGLKAVEVIDQQVGRLMKAILETDGTLLIASDHGNMERMLDPKTGLKETKHDPNPIPIYIVRRGYERNKDDFDVNRIESEGIGVLADVAPTVLELMGMAKPKEMTGISLLNQLR